MFGGLAQLVERLLCNQDVSGSSPLTSINTLGQWTSKPQERNLWETWMWTGELIPASFHSQELFRQRRWVEMTLDSTVMDAKAWVTVDSAEP